MIGYVNFISNFKCHCDTKFIFDSRPFGYQFFVCSHRRLSNWDLYCFTCLISEPADWILISFNVVYVHYTVAMNRML